MNIIQRHLYINDEVLKEIITIVTYTTQDSSLDNCSIKQKVLILCDLVQVVKPAETKFPKQKIYQHLTDYLRKTILAGISEGQVGVLREWAYCSSPSLGVDEAMKATVHLHLGLHYQTTIMLDSDSEEFFDKSKAEFKKVIKICKQSNCPNRDFLLARAYVFLAQNCYYIGMFDRAQKYLEKAKLYFSFLPNRHEKCCFVYQYVLLSTTDDLIGKRLSGERIDELGKLMNEAITYASQDDSYQANCLKFLMLCKKAMLFLHIFNLTHFKHRKEALDNCEVTTKDLDEANRCLQNVPRKFLNPEKFKVPHYQCLYFFTLSDYCRHQKRYEESLHNLQEAEIQLNKCKYDLCKNKINTRRSFLLREISSKKILA